MGMTEFLHGFDRLFNHKQWQQDEMLMLREKKVDYTHDENTRGIDANKDLNIEGSKNGVKYLSNGWSGNQHGTSYDTL